MDVRILGASIVVCQIYLCCYRNLPDKYTFPFFRNFRIGSCLFHSVLVFGWHVGCDWVCTPSWNTIYNGDLKMFLLFKGVIFRFQPLIVVPFVLPDSDHQIDPNRYARWVCTKVVGISPQKHGTRNDAISLRLKGEMLQLPAASAMIALKLSAIVFAFRTGVVVVKKKQWHLQESVW